MRDALHALERPLVADGGVRERGAVEAGAGAAEAHDAARGRHEAGGRGRGAGGGGALCLRMRGWAGQKM